MVDMSGDAASSDDVASMILNSVVATENIAAGNKFEVLPNPNNGTFIVKSAFAKAPAELQVMDMMGKTIFKTTVAETDLMTGYTVNQKLVAGMYLVKLKIGNSITTQKITVF
jgi:hypothetical protein